MTLHITMEGTSPLLMHNPQLIDPLNPTVRAIAELTGKRKKTTADYEEILQMHFFGALYYGTDGPFIPSANPLRCFATSATRHKLGKAVERGIVAMEPRIPLVYEGPREASKLWEDPQFRSVLNVKVHGAAVMRCRPRFFPWLLEFEVTLYPEEIDESMFRLIVEEAGILQGLGDGRRIGFGRFRGKVE